MLKLGSFALILLAAPVIAQARGFYPAEATVPYDSLTILSPMSVSEVLVDKVVPDAFGFEDGAVRLLIHASGGGDVKGHTFLRGWTDGGQTVTLYDLLNAKRHQDIGAFETVEFLWQPILPGDFHEGQSQRQTLTFLDSRGQRVAQVSALTTVKFGKSGEVTGYHLVLSDVTVTK